MTAAEVVRAAWNMLGEQAEKGVMPVPVVLVLCPKRHKLAQVYASTAGLLLYRFGVDKPGGAFYQAVDDEPFARRKIRRVSEYPDGTRTETRGEEFAPVDALGDDSSTHCLYCRSCYVHDLLAEFALTPAAVRAALKMGNSRTRSITATRAVMGDIQH